ncbi:MAG: hypothetical protein JXR76_26985 [Deltaproteobacteria bacterium]|nr:hypothetical protein [Deltaproteobacteria bacterium]
MNHIANRLFFAAAIVFCVACTGPYATMQTNGLKYSDYDVEVTSISKRIPRFIEYNWELGNWLERGSDHTWRRIDLPEFKGNVYVDKYNNGNPDRVKKYHSELVLKHDGSLSTLTVDLTTASSAEWKMSVEDMYKTFVANMAAKEPWNAGKRFEKSEVDKQAKITMLNYKAVKVLDYDGLIGYVNRSEFDSNAPDADMRFAIFMLKITDMGGLNRTKNLKGVKEEIPLVLLVVLESEPAEFNSLVDDFYALTELIRIKGKSFELEFLRDTARTEEPCDEEKAKKENKPCPDAVEWDINEEDVVSPPQAEKKKAKKKEKKKKKEKDDLDLF